MLKRPFFSIVIPTYNRAADLQFALYCIFQQTFSDFEVVISDNCSNDNTKSVVQNIKDKRIRYFRLKKTVGNAVNFKNGIKRAKGKYIFLHSDDDFILYSQSLGEVYNKIIRLHPGYVRINYVSLSLDKKRIFYYRIAKPFIKNEYFPQFLKNEKILSVILDSDPYFISGIIFRNDSLKGIKIVDSDPVPCIEVFFHVIRNYGAYFIAKQHMVASWSRREMKKNTQHHIYTLIQGKLRCEKYFEAVRKTVNKQTYRAFLQRELTHLFVIMFPIMKSSIGNKKILQISSRILLLDPTMRKSILFWAYLMVALLLPGNLLRILRDLFINLFARFSKVEGGERVYESIKNLEMEYSNYIINFPRD
jgi:glycosyltransferase involved in cell wall biosynthesis